MANTIYAFLLALSTTALLILLPALYRLHVTVSPTRPKPHPAPGQAHILIVLGSGGHTAEMLAMLERAGLDWKGTFGKRTWVVGEGDSISAERAGEFERGIKGGEGVVREVPRARRIHQSIYTAPLSCLRCARACWEILTSDFPDIILCNGPATATVLVFVAVLLRFLDFGGCHSRGKMRTVYVESWARVRRVSLSGWCVGWVVERCLVQWEGLRGRVGAGRGEFVGALV